MTRKRFRKLSRALHACVGRPDMIRLTDKITILPSIPLSYDDLWAPVAWMASVMGVGEKGARRGRQKP